MHWILMLVGALVGMWVADADRTVFGLLAGAFVGWQGMRLVQLRARIEALERGSAATTSAPPATGAQAPVPPPFPASASAATHARQAAPDAQPAPIQRAPAPAATPTGPDAGERIARWLRAALFEGNVPIKVGALVLLVALGGALKLLSDEGLLRVPLEWRLIAISVTAIAAVAWGWRSRLLRPAFGLGLQGLGIGALLLVVFAAFRLYQLLPAGLALVLVVALVAGAALLAVLQHAPWLALIGFIGGYLAPVLLSTGSGNHVALFGYYAVLNAAVLGIAWVRPWRALNLVGFAFTFGVGTLWGWRAYTPEHFASTEPFLVLFFLFYLAIPVLYALRQPERRRGLVDGTLVFGTPLIAFPLQAAMLHAQPMALAFSALALALLYALLAAWLLRSRRMLLLGQSFAALAVGFATVAVPMALSARLTAATWALEGAALVWLGLRQQQRLPVAAGWVLQGLAAVAWVATLLDGGWNGDASAWPLLNGVALSVLLMAASAFAISAFHDRSAVDAGRYARLLVWPPFLLGAWWWHVLWGREIAVYFDGLAVEHATAVALAISVLVFAILRQATAWARPGWLVAYGCVVAVPLAYASLVGDHGALQMPALPWWLLLLVALFAALRALRVPLQRGVSLAHVAVLWTLAIVLGGGLQHASWSVLALGGGWTWAALVLPLALLLLSTWRRPRVATWPLADVFVCYRLRWFAPALLVLAVLFAEGLLHPGDAAPLPFVPLLNPLELLQAGILLVLARLAWSQALPAPWSRALRSVLPLAAFAFVSMAGLRAVHQLAGQPWSLALLEDARAQAVLTVLWSSMAVSAWLAGSRRGSFRLWRAGALLIGVVLVKLVFIDRQYMGNVAGILSFVAVGILLVLVGRIAPSPPRGIQQGAAT